LSETAPFLDRCAAIALENGETAQPGSEDRVRIAALEFVKARPSNIPAFVLWGGGILCALAAIGLSRGAGAASIPAKPTVPSLNATPLDTPPFRAEVIRTWLEGHYHQPDVALEGLAKELALGPDATSKEIRKHFQDTFKGMINRLRLQEARRLLAESDLGIAEIAFKVGYGSIPHFNRLAKDAWGRTPTEERATLRRDPTQG
jgi:AraC-like DNA-binding protein